MKRGQFILYIIVPQTGSLKIDIKNYLTQALSSASLVAQQVKNPPEMWETWVGSLGQEDSPGEGKGYPLQYSGLENSMDCIVHGIAKSRTPLRDLHFPLSSNSKEESASNKIQIVRRIQFQELQDQGPYFIAGCLLGVIFNFQRPFDSLIHASFIFEFSNSKSSPFSIISPASSRRKFSN